MPGRRERRTQDLVSTTTTFVYTLEHQGSYRAVAERCRRSDHPHTHEPPHPSFLPHRYPQHRLPNRRTLPSRRSDHRPASHVQEKQPSQMRRLIQLFDGQRRQGPAEVPAAAVPAAAVPAAAVPAAAVPAAAPTAAPAAVPAAVPDASGDASTRQPGIDETNDWCQLVGVGGSPQQTQILTLQSTGSTTSSNLSTGELNAKLELVTIGVALDDDLFVSATKKARKEGPPGGSSGAGPSGTA
eukprot:scaffold55375_cov51-Phaeocystis_antarctica.AAC.2